VPIKFDADQRVVSSLPIQPDIGNWHTVTLNFQ
jgi:hypothetical protein